MKLKYKMQSISARKASVLKGHKTIWDKPLTTKLALQIINSVKLSHWSVTYDFWYENGPEGYFGQQTWVDLEAHDMGWVWSAVWDEAKKLGWSHKEYHKEVQRRLYEGVKSKLINMTDIKRVPKQYRPAKTWRKLENKSNYRVTRFVGFNSKSMLTTSYYIYRTDVTDVTPDMLIII